MKKPSSSAFSIWFEIMQKENPRKRPGGVICQLF